MRTTILLLLSLCLVAGPGLAATWYVEKDGSGDFDDIQPAVDAAAGGDTIRIGPGHYDQARSVLIPNWPSETDVFVFVDKEQLTFIGSGRDEVIIGPEEYYQTNFGPKCFATAGLSQRWRIENLTLQNAWDGVYEGGGLSAENCRIVGCWSAGIYTWAPLGAEVDDCVFEDNDNGGVSVFSPASHVRIRNSEFVYSSIHLQDVTDVAIENCILSGGPVVAGGWAFNSITRAVQSRTAFFDRLVILDYSGFLVQMYLYQVVIFRHLAEYSGQKAALSKSIHAFYWERSTRRSWFQVFPP